MVQYRPPISNSVKKRLVAEAGHKCANPGCPNVRSQIHHIREWAVYRTHDEKHMIAVCPACHDAIHHGRMKISDDLLYKWKQIERDPEVQRAQLYVEPGKYPELWFGSFALRVTGDAPVIALSKINSVSMRIEDSEVVVVDAHMCTLEGESILRVSNNRVTHQRRDGVSFDTVPGRVRVMATIESDVVPQWVLERMQSADAGFVTDGAFELFGAETIVPGVARISGVWARPDRAIIATPRALHFASRTHPGMIVHFAEREGAVHLQVEGEMIDNSVFGFADEAAVFRLENFDPRNGPLREKAP